MPPGCSEDRDSFVSTSGPSVGVREVRHAVLAHALGELEARRSLLRLTFAPENPGARNSLHAPSACSPHAAGSSDAPFETASTESSPEAFGIGEARTPFARMHSANVTALSRAVRFLVSAGRGAACGLGAARSAPSGACRPGGAGAAAAAGAATARACGDRRDHPPTGRRRRGSCESASDWSRVVLVCCRSCRHSRRRGVASTYAVFDTPTICTGSYHPEHAGVDRRGRVLHGGSHQRWPAAGSDRGRHRR